jgi:septum formation inhibitor-activating ATPase MinD
MGIFRDSSRISLPERLSARQNTLIDPRPDSLAGNTARSVLFHGCGGGAGATFLAAESAAMLSASGQRVAVVDADRASGGLHYRLDVPLTRDTFTVWDLVPILEDTTDHVIDNAFSNSPRGARLLPASIEPAEAAPPGCGRALLQALLPLFDTVIVDAPGAPDPYFLELVDSSDMAVLVVLPELQGLGRAGRLLDVILSRGNVGNVAIVVNRSLGAGDSLSVSDIEEFLKLPVTTILPEDMERCRRAGDEGRFVYREGTALGQGIRQMVRSVLS